MASEAPSSPAMPHSLKRSLPTADDEGHVPSTPIAETDETLGSSPLSSPEDVDTPKGTPMASTVATQSTTNTPSRTPSTHTALLQSSLSTTTPQLSSAPLTKRRKLTLSEKAEREAERVKKAVEKEALAKQKEEERRFKEEEKEEKRKVVELEKQRREDERKRKVEEKDEEKRNKEAERLKREAEREEKQRIKEFEKRNKDEEKDRRERTQLRLSSFFNVPMASPPAAIPTTKTIKAGASPSKHSSITKDQARRRSMSLDPVDLLSSPVSCVESSSDLVKQAKMSNVKGFLPFIPSKSMKLAPHNRFLPAGNELLQVNAELDNYAGAPPQPIPSVKESFETDKIKRGYQPLPVRDIMRKFQGSLRAPIDLTSDSKAKPFEALKATTVKYFCFGEDVRPPYRGTWTKPMSTNTASRIARKPWAREVPEINYDDDSEAEWEEPEDGEDIDIEGEEDEEDEEEELDGFIDDENEPEHLKARRALNSNDLEPVCSGIQWEDACGKLKAADQSEGDADFSEYAMCFLLEPRPQTIDPFTTGYWDPEPKLAKTLPFVGPPGMGPPRVPLHNISNIGNIQTTLVNGKVPRAAKAGPRLVPSDVLPAFTEAVKGSDLTKIALIEALKKQFPKLKKDEINDTLGHIAHRVGPKLNEKVWVLLADSSKA